jgi:hypothetical protein
VTALISPTDLTGSALFSLRLGAGNSSLHNIKGLWIDIVDPVLQQQSQGLELSILTYAFCKVEL